jgi:hypothetical protein
VYLRGRGWRQLFGVNFSTGTRHGSRQPTSLNFFIDQDAHEIIQGAQRRPCVTEADTAAWNRRSVYDDVQAIFGRVAECLEKETFARVSSLELLSDDNIKAKHSPSGSQDSPPYRPETE